MSEELKEVLEQCKGVIDRKIPLLILAPEYTKILCDYIEQLQQENESLKEALENKRVCYYNNKAYDIKTLINKTNILNELESWLEEKLNEANKLLKKSKKVKTMEDVIKYNTYLSSVKNIENILNKLKELKENNK